MSVVSAEIANEFWWSKLGFWILVVGLAGEIFVLRVPKTHETLEKVLTFVFVIVIIVGVTFEHNADTAVTELISKQETDFGVTIASLGKDAAASNERARSLEKEAEELRAKNLALEARIAWRELSPNTIAKFRAAIAAVPASVPRKVVFSYLIGDQEFAYLAYELGRYFIGDKNRWDLSVEVRLYVATLYWDVNIFGPDNPTTRAVREIFDSSGILYSKDELPPGFIAYGHQPLPDDTVIFIAPKEPSLSEGEMVRGREGSK